MAVISMKALLETGVHFGHRTRKWNPRMKPYIFTERNGIHIIDLQQTLESLENVHALVRDELAKGGSVLFVGTKRQGQESIQLEAERCGMPYVNSRWLGGTLTNWRTIRSRITELENLERRRDEGEFELLTKKEALTMTRKINKLEERLGGIRNMKGLPTLLFVVDVRREETAIHEANLLGIPVIALVDTNCDPSGVDYVIPSNDDAIRAIKLLTAKIADAVLEGMAMRKEADDGEDVPKTAALPVQDEEMSDEDLLGEATLAKLQTGDYDERAARAKAALVSDKEDDGDADGDVDETASADETTSVDETASADETTSVDEPTSVDETASADETTSEDKSTPVDETASADETASEDKSTPVDETASADETTSMDESTSVDETASEDKSPPVDETTSVEESPADEESSSMDEASPEDDISPNTEVEEEASPSGEDEE